MKKFFLFFALLMCVMLSSAQNVERFWVGNTQFHWDGVELLVIVPEGVIAEQQYMNPDGIMETQLGYLMDIKKFNAVTDWHNELEYKQVYALEGMNELEHCSIYKTTYTEHKNYSAGCQKMYHRRIGDENTPTESPYYSTSLYYDVKVEKGKITVTFYNVDFTQRTRKQVVQKVFLADV